MTDLGAAGPTPAVRRPAGRDLPARDLVAIGLAGAGTLTLFLSLLFDWVRVTGGEDNLAWEARAGIEDIPAFGTAYVLGGMFLVAFFVAVVVLPVPLARATRVLGIGWAVGLAGIVAAVVVRAANSFELLTGGPMASVVDAPGLVGNARTSWLFGLYDALVALVLMIAAFAAACPPLRDIGSKPADPDGYSHPS
jgi:hypothetical protein